VTSTADTATRQNSDSNQCPTWCVTDHGKYGFHASERILVDAPEFHRNTVRAIPGAGLLAEVAVNTLAVPAREAEDLALLLERIAEATPEQHRQLAAAIRQAAALVTVAGR